MLDLKNIPQLFIDLKNDVLKLVHDEEYQTWYWNCGMANRGLSILRIFSMAAGCDKKRKEKKKKKRQINKASLF